jgi:hypothetical protein
MAPLTTASPSPYTGYLAPHLDLIVEGHRRGLSTRAVAERLYAAGARARTSRPQSYSLTEAFHLANLQAMALYVLCRLGLRQRQRRRRRQLTARPRKSEDGATVWEVKA